jgi:hypothetical protein
MSATSSFYFWPAVVVFAGAACFAVGLMTSSYRKDQIAAAGRPADAAPARATRSLPAQNADKPAAARPAAGHIVIDVRQVAVSEPLPVDVSLQGASGDETVVVTGLARGTRLSAGEPQGAADWRIPAHALGRVLVYPPVSFAGIMAVAVELRGPDDALLDVRFPKLEWRPKPEETGAAQTARLGEGDAVLSQQAAPVPAPDQQAQSFKRAVGFLKDGNIAAARLMLQSAADARNAQAALLLGATYDPLMLADLGARGVRPDREAARNWYQRAQEYGASEAASRLERLAQTDR